jgi:voltage-gated potassium channel
MWEFVGSKGVTRRFYRRERSLLGTVVLRLSFAVILLLVVAGVFWHFEGDHIADSNSDGEFSYLDSLYFTIVSVTTVGYGDIVPITEEARMFDAVIITPVRIIVWVVFIGTAYQVIIQNRWERFRMTRALKKMKGHVIVAGYGTTGAAAVNELILTGYDENKLIVIDHDEELIKRAAEAGATGIVGDPTREESLSQAAIKNARTLIITTPQDDTNVLVTLTAKDLNPKLQVIARVGVHENIKQLKRAGADVIISPSLTSGNLMAMAVTSSNRVDLVSDLLTTSRGVNVMQRKALVNEIGKAPKALKGPVVIGVVRGGRNIGPKELDSIQINKDDQLILIG